MMPSVTMIFSIEIMSTLKEIKYHLKRSYHVQKSYPLPYPTPNLSYPLPYPNLPPTLTYPIPLPYPTLPYLYPTPYSTPPYPLPYPYPTLPRPTPPYPTLNQPVNLPSMFLSHVRYSLMSVSVFSCVILDLFWSVLLQSRLFWSVSVT